MKKYDNVVDHCYLILEVNNGKEYYKLEMGEGKRKLCQITLTEVDNSELNNSKKILIVDNKKVNFI